MPEEIEAIINTGSFPEDPNNPLVVMEFVNGEESLFDTRKGLFLSPPSGIELPPRETLKAFGRMIQDFRQRRLKAATPQQALQLETFAVCHG